MCFSNKFNLWVSFIFLDIQYSLHALFPKSWYILLFFFITKRALINHNPFSSKITCMSVTENRLYIYWNEDKPILNDSYIYIYIIWIHFFAFRYNQINTKSIEKLCCDMTMPILQLLKDRILQLWSILKLTNHRSGWDVQSIWI